MSVNTPILTTSSEICARATVAVSTAVANTAAIESFLVNINNFLPVAHWPLLFFAGSSGEPN
jgi:hypothetical protein